MSGCEFCGGELEHVYDFYDGMSNLMTYFTCKECGKPNYRPHKEEEEK